MRKWMIQATMALTGLLSATDADACTGITLRTNSGQPVAARTIEWAGNDIGSRYVIVPRGLTQNSYLPNGKKEGLAFTAKYGYVGLAVEQDEFVVEGLNEAGLSAGLFYFPGYGRYEAYHEKRRSKSISDLQLVSWVLGSFRTIDEMKAAIGRIHVTGIDPRASTVHWRVTEESGRQVILEIVDGRMNIYENQLGVLTNSPGFEWHLTNLNSYINLFAGPIANRKVGDLTLTAFGGGGGLHGIPGDMTPPSRFVRAAFFQATAPKLTGTFETVMQAFHILNNFDIPTGIQFAEGTTVPDIPSATQWTVASDLQHRKIYYRTMYDSTIRCFDLATIPFGSVKYQSAPLDPDKRQPVVYLKPQ